MHCMEKQWSSKVGHNSRNSYLEESYNIFKEKFSAKDIQNQSIFLLLVHPGYNFWGVNMNNLIYAYCLCIKHTELIWKITLLCFQI